MSKVATETRKFSGGLRGTKALFSFTHGVISIHDDDTDTSCRGESLLSISHVGSNSSQHAPEAVINNMRRPKFRAICRGCSLVIRRSIPCMQRLRRLIGGDGHPV